MNINLIINDFKENNELKKYIDDIIINNIVKFDKENKIFDINLQYKDKVLYITYNNVYNFYINDFIGKSTIFYKSSILDDNLNNYYYMIAYNMLKIFIDINKQINNYIYEKY